MLDNLASMLAGNTRKYLPKIAMVIDQFDRLKKDVILMKAAMEKEQQNEQNEGKNEKKPSKGDDYE
jgi:hypothetical protein